jgi:hypothetical protein
VVPGPEVPDARSPRAMSVSVSGTSCHAALGASSTLGRRCLIQRDSTPSLSVSTRLTYTGELGTDLWRLGQAWGHMVARSRVHAVRDSLAAIRAESERRAMG